MKAKQNKNTAKSNKRKTKGTLTKELIINMAEHI